MAGAAAKAEGTRRLALRHRTVRHLPVLLTSLCLALIIAGCSTSPERGKWGKATTITPGWSTIGRAAQRAATSKSTWLPLAAGALLYASDADEHISRWAVKEEPLFFGDAGNASDKLKEASKTLYILSVVASDSGDTPDEWLYNKAKGILVGSAAQGMVAATTDTLKEEVGRERPNGENTRSFISGHVSYTAARINLASRNLDYTALEREQKMIARVALHSVTAAEAWARVESESHYPSDVLAAIAVANFFTNFMYDAFLQPLNDDIAVTGQWDGDNYLLLFSRHF